MGRALSSLGELFPGGRVDVWQTKEGLCTRNLLAGLKAELAVGSGDGFREPGNRQGCKYFANI